MSSARDFDFLLGHWSVRHRRLRRRLAGDTTWVEFEGTAVARPILQGLGNFDEIQVALPDDPYVGSTLRLFDPVTGLWTIYWMETRRPALDPPMVGAFDGGVGTFFGDDVFEGRSIRVRFLWSSTSDSACRWEQAFSGDGGQTWETNWVMTFTRLGKWVAASRDQ